MGLGVTGVGGGSRGGGSAVDVELLGAEEVVEGKKA